MPEQPPGPKGTWLGGNLAEFRADRLAFFTRCAREFGDVASVRLGNRRIWVVSDPHLIENVLAHQSRHYHKHFALRLNSLVLGNGLLTSEGDFWLRQRRLMQPVFQKSRIAAYAPVMVERTLHVLESWRPGDRRDIHHEMMRLTLDIAALTLFGASAEEGAEDVAAAMEVLQDSFKHRFARLVILPLWLPLPSHLRLRRVVRRLDAILYGFIRKRKEKPGTRDDLLSRLLAARDEVDGRGMSDRQLRDEAMTLFLAGHETTALALSWTWWLLARHPEAAQRLAGEVDEVLQGRLPTAEDCPRLRYAEGVILESMRLYPPAYVVGREAMEEVPLGPYVVPRGHTVLMSQWAVQRDPRWFPEPEEFRPERWGEEAIHALPRFAYFPFGGGPRVCIGNTFAMMEMVLVLALLAQRFRFTLQPGAQVLVEPTFTLRPDPGVPAVVEPRVPA